MPTSNSGSERTVIGEDQPAVFVDAVGNSVTELIYADLVLVSEVRLDESRFQLAKFS